MRLTTGPQKFTDLKRVASSNFSTVYSARDPLSDNHIALKVANPAVDYSETILRQEFDFLSVHRHPNFVSVYDYGQNDEGVPFFSMEWVDGSSLLASCHRQSTATISAAVLELCEAMAALHATGHVHCDLTPGNVLVHKKPNGNLVTILDFGLTTRAFSVADLHIRGTDTYIAPEIPRGDCITPACDMYSFGKILHKLEQLLFAEGERPAAFPLNRQMIRQLADWCRSSHPESRPGSFETIADYWASKVCRRTDGREPRRTRHVGCVKFVGRAAERQILADTVSELSAAGGGLVLIGGGPRSGKSSLLNRFKAQIQPQISGSLRFEVHTADELRNRLPEVLAASESYITETSTGDLSSAFCVFLKYHAAADLSRADVRWLLELAESYGVVLLITHRGTGTYPRSERLRKIVLAQLSLTEFEELCRANFPQDQWRMVPVTHLHRATGGIPSLLAAKAADWHEWRRKGKDSEAFRWRRIPAAAQRELLAELEPIAKEIMPIAGALGEARGSFTVAQIAQHVELPSRRIRMIIRLLEEGGFVRVHRHPQRYSYAFASTWHRDCFNHWYRSRRNDGLLLPDDSHQPAIHRSGPVDTDLTDIAELIQQFRRNVRHAPSGDSLSAASALAIRIIKAYATLKDLGASQKWIRRLAGIYAQRIKSRQAIAYDRFRQFIRLLSTHSSGEFRQTWIENILQERALSRNTTALLHSELGLTQYQRHDYQRALTHYHTAEALWNKGDGDQSARARNYNRIGVIYQRREKLDQAEGYLFKAQRIAEEVGDREVLVAVNVNLGVLTFERGHVQAALERYEISERYARETANHFAQAFILRNKTSCVAELCHSSEAIKVAHLALHAAIEAKHALPIAGCTGSVGWCYLRAGDTEKAYEYIMRSIELHRASEDLFYLGINTLNLSRLSAIQGKRNQAMRYALQAFRYARRCDAPSLIVESLIEAATNAAIQGRVRVASRYHAYARRFVTDGVPTRNLFYHDIIGAEIALLAGQTDAAETILNRWPSDERDGHVPDWQILFDRCQAHFHLVRGEVSAGLAALKAAIWRARQFGRFDLLPDLYERLAVALARRNRPGHLLPVLQELTDLTKRVGRMCDYSELLRTCEVTISKAGDSQFAQLLFNISQSLHRIADREELLDYLINTAVDYFGADRGALIYRHPVSGKYFIEVSCSRGPALDREDTIKISRSIVRRVGKRAETVRIEDAQHNAITKSKKSILALNIQSVLCVPVHVHDDLWGVLYLDNQTVPRAFEHTSTTVLQAFANFMAFGLEYATEVARQTIAHKEPADIAKHGVPFIAQASSMEQVMSDTRKAAASNAAILLLGESGTGKDALAEQIHQMSSRRDGPFVKLNCASLPPSLIEAELFGIGANVATNVDFREGRFRLADGGTLFLNEIAELPPTLQAKLLQVLEDGEFERVGGDRVSVDVRFICATNKNLGNLIDAGHFRLDLYYRINTIMLELPPLRKREDDIPLLVQAFWEYYHHENRKPLKKLPQTALDAFMKHTWPGNIRELKNIIARMVILGRTEIRLGEDATTPASESMSSSGGLRQQLESFERSLIRKALDAAGWNVAQAARNLRIADATLRSRIKALQIHRSSKT